MCILKKADNRKLKVVYEVYKLFSFNGTFSIIFSSKNVGCKWNTKIREPEVYSQYFPNFAVFSRAGIYRFDYIWNSKPDMLICQQINLRFLCFALALFLFFSEHLGNAEKYIMRYWENTYEISTTKILAQLPKKPPTLAFCTNSSSSVRCS